MVATIQLALYKYGAMRDSKSIDSRLKSQNPGLR